MFNVANINLCTEAEGPFKRVAIWFQGCKKRCKSCCNSELQDLIPKHLIPYEELLSLILDAKKQFEVEGVTFLGGEPTLQIELLMLCKELNKLGIGMILFTGYKIDEISSEYRKYCDLIVDGEFDVSRMDIKRNMIGSINQEIHLCSDRYKNDINWFLDKREKNIEINIGNDDNILFSGDVFKSN